MRDCAKICKNLFDDQIFWKKVKKKTYNIINKIINNAINTNFFVHFHTIKSLFNAAKIIDKQYNNFFSHEFIIDHNNILHFWIKNWIWWFNFMFKKFFQRIATKNYNFIDYNLTFWFTFFLRNENFKNFE